MNILQILPGGHLTSKEEPPHATGVQCELSAQCMGVPADPLNRHAPPIVDPGPGGGDRCRPLLSGTGAPPLFISICHQKRVLQPDLQSKESSLKYDEMWELMVKKGMMEMISWMHQWVWDVKVLCLSEVRKAPAGLGSRPQFGIKNKHASGYPECIDDEVLHPEQNKTSITGILEAQSS